MQKIKPIEIDRDHLIQLAEQKLKQKDEDAAIRYYLQFLSNKKPHKHKYLAYYNLGHLFIQRHKLEEGLDFFQKSIQEKSDFTQSWLTLGNILFDLQHFEQAYDFYKGANKLEPKLLHSNVGLAEICMVLGREDEALAYFKTCCEIEPDNSLFLDRVSFTNFLLGEWDEALAYQLKAIALSESPEGLFNLAEIYKKKLQLDNSINSFRKAIKSKADWIDAHVNFSHVLLLNGDYLEGWKEHEWRRKKDHLSRDVEFKQPHWDGCEDLNGKTILLYGEQGFGDTIQFIRYLPLIKKEFPNTNIIFECNQPLKTLLSQFTDITDIYEYFATPKDSFDYHCSVMSLPHYFKTTLDTIPNQLEPYLKPDADKVTQWRRKLTGSKIKVGLVWHGRSVSEKKDDKELIRIGKKRNIPLKEFMPLFEQEHIQFYSLQKGDKALDIKELNLSEKVIDYTEEFNDFSDTASFIEALDLVVGVDTGVIHLACAIGKPTWMLSRFDGCWRWMTEEKFGDKSPWYPTLKIYRQKNWEGWEAEIQRVKQDLSTL